MIKSRNFKSLRNRCFSLKI